jgi:predicted DNA-binding transcriptional regulator AlpA
MLSSMNNRMGPQTSGQAHPRTHSALPDALVTVALIDAPTCAAVGDMSLSWWYERVASGEAPPPAVRSSRCTRWRLADVRAFWLDFAKDGKQDEQLIQRAKAASLKAHGTRRARAAERALIVQRGA